MNILLNGSPKEIDCSMTISELLESFGLEKKEVAIEYNLKVLQKDDYATTFISEGDRIEVVRFVGGG
jgi:sulfur carrier protein